MWTALVIILPPTINRFPGMNNIAEPVLVQAFISKSSVKTLNKSVLSRFAWLDKTQFHAMLKGLLIKRAAGEFRPLIDSYRGRITTK
ncbi:hypothetical protein HA38_15965 [Pantoea allii]|nr:hypothetical protein HA38_15965 [Pantoea allii]